MCLNREKKWTHEGFMYRREDVVIITPKPYETMFRIRRVGDPTNKFPYQPGECNVIDRRRAFYLGNKLVKMMRQEKRKLQKK